MLEFENNSDIKEVHIDEAPDKYLDDCSSNPARDFFRPEDSFVQQFDPAELAF